jgi:hypothetical protein
VPNFHNALKEATACLRANFSSTSEETHNSDGQQKDHFKAVAADESDIVDRILQHQETTGHKRFPKRTLNEHKPASSLTHITESEDTVEPSSAPSDDTNNLSFRSHSHQDTHTNSTPPTDNRLIEHHLPHTDTDPSHSIQLLLTTPPGDTITIDMDNQDVTVLELKHLLQQKTAIPPGKVNLIFNKKVLQNDHTIKEYNIVHHSHINSTLRILGGTSNDRPRPLTSRITSFFTSRP